MPRRGLLLTMLPLLCAAAAGAQAAPEQRQPRTRSHRTRPRPQILKPPLPAKPLEPQEPSADIQARPRLHSKPLPKEPRLSRGRWNPAVADALERILEYFGEGNPGYSPADPPVAVFGFENVVINGHLGEAIFHRMVRRADFKFNEAFWNKIPQQYGRGRVRAGYEGFKNAAGLNRAVDPYYRMYRKGMLRAYRSICEAAGRPACRRWIATLLMNYGERDLRNYSRDTLIEELNRPVGFEAVGDAPGDPRPERERTGIRIIPETQELLGLLRQRGFDVWLLSTSNDWSAKIFGEALGIHPRRIVGIRVKADDGFLGGEALIPTPAGIGAAEAMTLFIGRIPVLAMAKPEDKEILDYGPGTRILVSETGDDNAAARRPMGWFQQEAFSPIRSPQRLPAAAAPAP